MLHEVDILKQNRAMALSMHSAELIGLVLESFVYGLSRIFSQRTGEFNFSLIYVGCMLTMLILVLLVQARFDRPWDLAHYYCLLMWALATVVSSQMG